MSASRADASSLSRALSLLLAVWLLPGLAGSAVLLSLFGQTLGGVWLHGLVLLAILQTVLLPSLAELLEGRWLAWQRIFTAVVLAALQFGWLVFFVGSVIGHRYWGNWLTLDLALAYGPQLPGLLEALDVHAALPAAMAALVALALGGLYLHLVAEVARARARVPGCVSQRVGLCLLAGLLASLALLYRHWYVDAMFWRQEPLRQASLSTGRGQAGISTQVSAARLQRELQVAATYPGRQDTLAAVTPRPLVLIIIDALRSDVMGVYGAPSANTPFLSALYRGGDLRRIDDVYSVCTSSYCGILGTLASKQWFELTPQPWNIADALSRLGYESRFLLSGDHTSFFGLRRMYGTAVTRLRDGSDQKQRYANDDRLVLDALDLEGWPQNRSGFLYVHLMSAHRLGLVDDAHKHWNERNTPVFSRFQHLHPAEHLQRHARYHNGIRQADAMVEQIFQRLERWGLLDDALVVITSDHGEHLGETGRWSHGNLPHEPGVRIPLLVHDRRDRETWPQRRLVSQTDIAPTMLQAIGAPVPATWSGVPLQRPTTRQALVVESSEATGVVVDDGRGRYKYLRMRADGAEQLFQIHPQGGDETADLAMQPEHQATLQRMRREHDQLLLP
jgi:glucan phosphoethanolaminetransferase (alkaline phosphatase superfamily)